jgi:hypothetical protein
MPKSVMMFKGIKGLVASGPGKTKKVDNQKLRPEGAVSIDAGNLKPRSGAVAAKPAKIVKHGLVNVSSHIRPEGGISRDSADVVKP